jgi:hypothetical protein
MPSPSASRTLANASLIVPEFVLDKNATLTISTQYTKATSSTGKQAYVVFNGPVQGPFYNWYVQIFCVLVFSFNISARRASVDMCIRTMDKKSTSFKGFLEIDAAHQAWDRFLLLGNKGLPRGMSPITIAHTQLAAATAVRLRYQLQSAPETPLTTHRPEDNGPLLLSPYISQSSCVVQPSTPPHPLSHAVALPSTRQGVATASPKYIVVLVGECPGVYSTADDNIPAGKSEVVDTLAAANQQFVTAYMSNCIRNTYAGPST